VAVADQLILPQASQYQEQELVVMLEVVVLPLVVVVQQPQMPLQQLVMAVMVTPAHLQVHQQFMEVVVDVLFQLVMLMALVELAVVDVVALKVWQALLALPIQEVVVVVETVLLPATVL
jgi:hypothetical protein